MVYAYLRVSTGDQTEESQKIGLDEFARQKGLKVDVYVVDHAASGAKELRDRNIWKICKNMKKDDTVITSEISRIGRKLVLVLEFVKMCTEKSVNLMTYKDRYVIGDNIQSKVLVTVMGLAAEIERDLCRQRTKEGLMRRKAEGVVLGRPKGSKNIQNKLTDKENKLSSLLKTGCSKTLIAKKLNISRNTLYIYLKQNNLMDVK